MIQLEPVLARYLFCFRQLSIPAVGEIQLTSIPAQVLFSEKCINPPGYRFVFSPALKDDPRLNKWLSKELQISPEETEVHLNNFSNKFRMHLQAGSELQWTGVGTFIKDEQGEIQLKRGVSISIGLEGVAAEKALRPDQSHTIRVGEEERSNYEMEAILQKKQIPVRNHWWLAALFLLILGIGSLWAISKFLPESWFRFSNSTPIHLNQNSSPYEWIH